MHTHNQQGFCKGFRIVYTINTLFSIFSITPALKMASELLY